MIQLETQRMNIFSGLKVWRVENSGTIENQVFQHDHTDDSDSTSWKTKREPKPKAPVIIDF